MKLTITIEGNTQPDLIDAIERIKERLQDGLHLNVTGCGYDIRMKPADQETEDEYYRQYALAHPAKPVWK